MSKTAFIFPGQGSQYIGMGKEFYETYPVSREIFDLASRTANFDVAALCFEENDKLNITSYTQLAMVTMEIAVLEALREQGYTADVYAGLSLGEYAALGAAGVISYEQLFPLVRSRGIFMQEAYPEGGAMLAVLGLDSDTVKAVCEETMGIVTVANDNCPGQIVISGEEKAVAAAGTALKEKGARCIPLKVSGPFHSPLLKGAGEKLKTVLYQVAVNAPEKPYIANLTAEYVTSAENIRELLADQVSSTVRWRETMERMLADGVDTFVEIGPGKTLSGFLKKMKVKANIINIETPADLEKCKNLTGGQMNA